MIEAYKIGVSLILETNIPAAVGSMMSQLERLNAVLKQVQGNANALKSDLRGLAASMDAVSRAAGRAEKAASGMSGSARSAADASRETADNYERAARAATSIVSAPRLLAGPRSGGGGALVSAPLLLGYTGGAAAGAGGALSPFYGYPAGGGGEYPEQLQIGHGGRYNGNGGGIGGDMPDLSLSPSGGGPKLITIAAGVASVALFFDLLDKIIDKAAALNTEITKLHLAGVTKAETDAIEALAFDLTDKIPGRKVEDIVRDVRHMRAVLGEEDVGYSGGDPLGVIKDHLPQVERAAVLIHNATGEDTDKAMARLMKALELRGDVVDPKTHQIDAARFDAGLEAAMKFIIAMNGLGGTNDLLMLMKQAGPAARMTSDPMTFYAALLAPVLDMGGARAGTALTAAYRQLIGGIMTKQKRGEMIQMGMLSPEYDEKKGVATIRLVGDDILRDKGLFAWVHEIASKNMAAKGIHSSADVTKEEYKILGTETFRRLFDLYANQAQQVIRDAKLLDKIPGIEDGNKILNDESLTHNVTAFGAAWDNLMSSIGNGGVQAKIAVLQGLSAVLNNFTHANQHSMFDDAPLINDWSPFYRPPASGRYGGSLNEESVVRVHVVNQPRDPITGLSNGASRPSSGPSGFDWRASPAIPGLGVP